MVGCPDLVFLEDVGQVGADVVPLELHAAHIAEPTLGLLVVAVVVGL